MTRIFLIGYMGAGKTTLGKAFAREMSLNFIDLDWFIEERFHKTAKRRFLRKPYANHGILKFYSERRLSRK